MSRAYKDDEVFFHHKGKPKSGKVLCAGRHGCTVAEEDGTQHKLKWHHLAGHKSRAHQQYKVIEHGEDGMIVETEGGHRRFIGIPPEARAEQLALDQQAKPNARGTPEA